MLVKNKFRKSTLAYDMQCIFHTNDINKYLVFGIFLSAFVAPISFAQTTAEVATQPSQSLSTPVAIELPVIDPVVAPSDPAKISNDTDSMQLLQEQSPPNPKIQFKPIEFEDLEDLAISPVDQSMANEIYAAADEAKKEAELARKESTRIPEQVVKDSTVQEITEMTRAPVDIDQLMNSIQADSKIVVEANSAGRTLNNLVQDESEEPVKKLNFLQRIVNKVRPSKDNIVVAAKITVSVEGAPPILAENIKAKLSAFTVESFTEYSSAVPQLRALSNQAAQAVGYYNAAFKFEKVTESKVKIKVTPGNPVKVEEEEIAFFGAGANLPQFRVIGVLPDLYVGDTFNHGYYEKTKSRILEAASNNGFFDGYWLLHDVRVNQPENTADINLRYETGSRYKLGEVEFRMSDPSKPFPINLDILKTLAPWEEGADYTAWRVNGLASNLTNSRYFNYTLVDAIKPDPMVVPLELPPDIQALVDQQKITESELAGQATNKVTAVSAKEVTQTIVDEKQFAGTEVSPEAARSMRVEDTQHTEKETEAERLKILAREEKRIPVIVTLNADQLNSLETGLGYGTDTGVRLRSQYRRAIVNRYGHSFDANLEVSQIRQAIDGRYNIPYTHPLNDYISLVGGYEREDRDNVGPDMSLVIESAVLGADRIIKGARMDWQHIFGVRYRLDRVTQQGVIDNSEIPDAFVIPGARPEQESLLMGYEVSKTLADQRINPTRGFKQSYKIELGSRSLLTDTNMAIINTNWKGLYSFGENDNYQVLGGANLGYIFAEDFTSVPYNLRYFAGGDQSMRGFDYKSLSPMEYGYKVGGQALAVGTAEFNYQFKEGWRAAVFSDFGNAYDKTFSNETEYSVGVGLRWRSPIGPIRIDLASGISQEGSPIRLHFFIGSQL